MKTISLALGCLLLTSQSFADICSQENEVWNGAKCITVGVSAAATAAQAAKSISEYKTSFSVYNELVSGKSPAAMNLYQYTGKANQTGLDPSTFLGSLQNGDKVIVVYSDTAPRSFRQSADLFRGRGISASKVIEQSDRAIAESNKLKQEFQVKAEENRLARSRNQVNINEYIDQQFATRKKITLIEHQINNPENVARGGELQKELSALYSMQETSDTKWDALSAERIEIEKSDYDLSRMQNALSDKIHTYNKRKHRVVLGMSDNTASAQNLPTPPTQEKVFTVSNPSEVQRFLQQQVKQNKTIVSVTRVPANKIAEANAILKKAGFRNLAGVFLAGAFMAEEIAFGKVAQTLSKPSIYRPEFSSALKVNAAAK